MNLSPDWSGVIGDIWARRWRELDHALAGVGEALDATIGDAAPPASFRALDVGCGPGTTSLALAAARPDASILGCDLSSSLVSIAQQRAERVPCCEFIAEDAEKLARERGPFDLIISRHGVMFFDDASRAFRSFRSAATLDGRLVFSCFQNWDANPWASEVASAAAGTRVPPPGREPGGFAFAEVDHVRDILESAGWTSLDHRALTFNYIAGDGTAEVDEALAFLSDVGPASRVIQGLADHAREDALQRMRRAIDAREVDGTVSFPAAAWIWSASAR